MSEESSTYHNGSTDDTTCSDTRNGPTHNEGIRIGRSSADERSELEDTDKDQVNPLGRVEGILWKRQQNEAWRGVTIGERTYDSAEKELERAHC
jgi:hypothetical protein